jgi:hypothetical protein
MRRVVLLIALGTGFAFPIVDEVTAATPKSVIRITSAGQAAARGALVRRDDLGKGWRAEKTPPTPVSSATSTAAVAKACPGLRTSYSSVVKVGDAESAWSRMSGHPEFVDSATQIIQPSRVAQAQWREVVDHPLFERCFRWVFIRELGIPARVRSFTRLSLPSIGAPARAFRMIAVLGEKPEVAVAFHVVFMMKRRSDMILALVTVPANAGLQFARAVRLARLMASRAT